MGGHKTDKNNLVVLTAREHFIAHFLLAKIYKGNQWAAIIRMRGNAGFYVNSKLYEIAKIENAKNVSKRFKNIPKSDETKEKMSKSALGIKKSPEAIEKNRQARIGKKPNANQLAALLANRHLAWGKEAQEKKSIKTKGVSRPYAKNSKPPSIESCSLGGKAGTGRKQTAEQIAKRMASKKATLAAKRGEYYAQIFGYDRQFRYSNIYL
jgi:hypothetical protein